MTGLLGTINGNSTRKKTGWAQFYINVFTALITLATIHPLLHVIDLAGIHDPLVALVSFHTSFNMLGILLILPFIRYFTRWIDTLGSGKTDILTSFLSPSNTTDVIACIDALERESLLFLQKAIHVRSELYNQPHDAIPADAYYALKEYENDIFLYSLPTLQQSLNKSEAQEIQQLYSSIRSATLSVKEIKDVRHNIADFRQSARDELFALEKEISHFFMEFSQDLTSILHLHPRQEMLQDMTKQNESFYEKLKTLAFESYRKQQDFDLASLLNFIREVRDSNQLMIRSIELLWLSIQNKTAINTDNGGS
jgi:phosphate:Na+ symporter